MIKKTVTFQDLDGNTLVEDFYFALNTAEITELVLTEEDLMGFFERLSTIQDLENVKPEDLPINGGEIMTIFKKLISMSVGKRSEDGRRFIKNEDVRNDFLQTDAYSQLFIELVTHGDRAADFINGITPPNFAETVQKMVQQGQTATDAPAVESGPVEPDWVTQGRVPTPEELKGATPEQIQLAFQRKSQGPTDVVGSQGASSSQ